MLLIIIGTTLIGSVVGALAMKIGLPFWQALLLGSFMNTGICLTILGFKRRKKNNGIDGKSYRNYC